MRLIDADELILHLNDFMLQQSPIDIQDIESIKVSAVIKDCIKAVDEQPIAYDVDKVLEQLKNNTYNMEICEEIPSKRKDIATFVDKEYKMIKLDDAIEIVKGGGIDENI